jgi:hypothetical protein
MPNPEGIGGRPTKYDPKQHPKKVRELAAAGFTDKRIAAFFEISESTLNLWKLEHTKFSEHLHQGRHGDLLDLTKSLGKKAKGYRYKEVKQVIAPAGTRIEMHPDPADSSKLIEVSVDYPATVIETTETIKHLPPDVAALRFMLANRDPENWREAAHIDHTTKGKELPGNGLDLTKLSDEEIRILAELEKKAKV